MGNFFVIEIILSYLEFIFLIVTRYGYTIFHSLPIFFTHTLSEVSQSDSKTEGNNIPLNDTKITQLDFRFQENMFKMVMREFWKTLQETTKMTSEILKKNSKIFRQGFKCFIRVHFMMYLLNYTRHFLKNTIRYSSLRFPLHS